MKLSDIIKAHDPWVELIFADDRARPGPHGWSDDLFNTITIASSKRDAWAWALVYFLEWVRREVAP